MPEKRTRGRAPIDMMGRRCGQLTVLCRQGTMHGHLAAWRVECICGTVFVAAGAHLRAGKVWRCRECAAKGQSADRMVHGESNGYLYRIWLHIRRAHKDSGSTGQRTPTGRGAPVCRDWHNYERFAHDIRSTIGERPNILLTLALAPGMNEWCIGKVRWQARADWMARIEQPRRRRRVLCAADDCYCPG